MRRCGPVLGAGMATSVVVTEGWVASMNDGSLERLVSVDAHILVPPGVRRDPVLAKYRDRVPARVGAQVIWPNKVKVVHEQVKGLPGGTQRADTLEG